MITERKKLQILSHLLEKSLMEKFNFCAVILKKDVINVAGSLKVCADQESGGEASIHAMYDIYNDKQLSMLNTHLI